MSVNVYGTWVLSTHVVHVELDKPMSENLLVVSNASTGPPHDRE